MSPAAPAVFFNRVHKSFAATLAVRDLSFSVPAGTICGFLGSNGAGKTTILRLILGILRPDLGQLEVLGASNPTRHRQQLTYLPEEKGLYRRMGVLEYLVFLGRLRGLSAPHAKARALHWLERLQLAETMHRRCETLSKGMSQKVQIAGALLHEPKLVIFDEPFSGLDPMAMELVREILIELRRAHRTVLVSTHVIEQAEQLCDHVVLLDRGVRLLSGPIARIRSEGVATVRLTYEGDATFLAQLPGVLRVNDSGMQAELSLEPDADPDRLLAALVGRLRIRRFEFAEPSLHEIFMRTVASARAIAAPESAS